MTSTLAQVRVDLRPEFRVVRRLRRLGSQAGARSVPDAGFSADLRARLVAEAEAGRLPVQRVAGSDCAD